MRCPLVPVQPHWRWALVAALLATLAPGLAYAHVKWFSHFTHADRPRTLGEIASPTFWGLLVLATVTIGGLAFVDKWLSATAFAQRVDAWLEQFRGFWQQRLDALGTEIARGRRRSR